MVKVMNKKLIGLAEKAGFSMWTNEPHKPPSATIDWSCEYDEELQAFYELIVKECAAICTDILEDKDIPYSPKTAFACRRAIEQNFKIEQVKETVEVELTDSDFNLLAITAHERDITINQLIEQIILDSFEEGHCND